VQDSVRLGPGLDDDAEEDDASEVDPHPDLPDDFDEIDSDRESIESIPDPRHRDPLPDPDEPAP
jgi:hypothetical protein